MLIEEEVEEASAEPQSDKSELSEHERLRPGEARGARVADQSLVTKEMGESSLQLLHSTKDLRLVDKVREVASVMNRYHPLCSIKLMRDPHNLGRKFGRSFTMAVRVKKTFICQAFPKQSIQTCYVSLNQLSDFKSFSEQRKSKKIDELITTPLHLAC